MDLSTGGDLTLSEKDHGRCKHPHSSVPIYQAASRVYENMTSDDMSMLSEHADDGIDFITVH